RVRERGLNNSNYEVQLNSKFPYEIKPLPSDAEIVKKTSFTDKWSRYYIIIFTKQPTSTFGLKLINRTTKSGITLNFKK
ncbi:MAG: hypothetical protein OIF32_01850, partial [Campylobacterales bacterium]|nr:hypothetical protein [Campylobacterales bacterium]